MLNRESRAELLAQADPGELVELADRCLSDGVELTVLIAPEVGCVTAQVREPVAHERFLLGDVLAVRAEVEMAGHRGWAMRMGADRAACLASAVLDAEVQSGRPCAADVEELCVRVARRIEEAEHAEWAELAPTVVEFEELT